MEAAEDELPTPGQASGPAPKGRGEATPKTKRNYVKLPPGRKLELLKMLDAGVSKETLMKEFAVSRTTLYLYKMNIDKMKHQLMASVPGGSGGPRRKRKRRTRLGWKKILPQTDDEDLMVNPKVEPQQPEEETKPPTPPIEEPLPPPQPPPPPVELKPSPLEPEPFQPLLVPPVAPSLVTNNSRRGKRKRRSINLPRKHSRARWLKLCPPAAGIQQMSTISATPQMTSSASKYSAEPTALLDQPEKFKTEGRTRASTSAAQDSSITSPKPRPPGIPVHSELGNVGGKGDQLHVQHNFHSQKILEVLTCDETFIDVTLTAEGRSVRAHKLILSAMSPYFQEVLQTNPCQHPVIIMPRTVRFSHLTQIIDFIYRGEITLPEEELRSLLNTAEHLQISGFSTPEIMKLLGETPPDCENTLNSTASSSLLTPTSEDLSVGKSVEVQLEVGSIRGTGRGRGGVRRARGGRRTRGGRRGRGRGGRMARSSEDIISSCGQRLVRASQYTPPISTSLSPSPPPSLSLPPLPTSPEPLSSLPARPGSTRTFQRVDGGHLRQPVDDPMGCSPGTVLGMDVDIDIVKEEVLSESEDNVSEAGENVVFVMEGESLQVCPDSQHPSLTCGTLQATSAQPPPPPLFTTATQPLLPRPALFTGVATGVASQGVSSLPRTDTAVTLAPAVSLFGSHFEVAPQVGSQPSQGVSVASLSNVPYTGSSPAPHSDGSYMVTSPASHSEASFEATSPAPQSEASFAVASPAQHNEGPSMAISPTPHSESSYMVTSPTVQSEASCEVASPVPHSESSSSDEGASSPHGTSQDTKSSTSQGARHKAATPPLPSPQPQAQCGGVTTAVTSPTPVQEAEAGHQAALEAPPSPKATSHVLQSPVSQAPGSPLITSQAPHSPMTTLQAPHSPMATTQPSASPLATSQLIASPMTSQAPASLMTSPKPASPMTTSQAPASPMTSPKPASPVTTSQAPASPMTSPKPASPMTSPKPASRMTSPKPASPMTSPKPASPMTSPKPASPMTSPKPASPMTTLQAPASPMSTLEAPASPMTTPQVSHTPRTKPPCSPMAFSPPPSPVDIPQLPHSPKALHSPTPHTSTVTSQTSHSPILTSQSSHSPILTSQPAHSPILTAQPSHSPILTSQSSHSPVLASQPSHSPILTSQPSHSPILTSHPLQSPMAISQPSHSPILTSQPSHSPILTSQPLHSPIVTKAAPSTSIESVVAALSSVVHSAAVSPREHSMAKGGAVSPGMPQTAPHHLAFSPPPHEGGLIPPHRDRHAPASPQPLPATYDVPLPPVERVCGEAASSLTTGLSHQAASPSPSPPRCEAGRPSPQGEAAHKAGSPLPHLLAPQESSHRASPPPLLSSPCEASSLIHHPGISGVSASPPHKATTEAAVLLPPLLRSAAACLVSTPATSPLLPTASTTTASTASPPQRRDDFASELGTAALLSNLPTWGTNPTQYQPSCETIPLPYPETSSLQYSSELGSFQISQAQYSGLGYQTNAPQYQPSYETIGGQYGEPGYQPSPPHYSKLVYGTNPPQYTTPSCQTSPLQQYQPNFETSTLQFSEPTALETFPAPATYGVAGCESGEQPTVAAPTTSPTMYYDPSCPDSPHHLQYSQL